jgi:hypothetical protein
MVIVLGASGELKSVHETPRQVHDVALTTDYILQLLYILTSSTSPMVIVTRTTLMLALFTL